MPGEIALVGGEEFRVGCEEMDREIMRASGQDPAKVVIIPTAAVTGPAKAANDGVTHFGALGGASSRLMVLNGAQANDPDFIRPAAEADVAYFTGGDPNFLLTALRDSALLQLLLERAEQGMVLGGSSAGAMVMGSVMRRPGGGDWADALGLVPDLAVLPHHERRNPATTAKELQDSAPAGVTFLGIDARSGCLGKPGEWLVVGSGNATVYQNGQWQVYYPGQTISAVF